MIPCFGKFLCMISIITITYNNYDELVRTLGSLPKNTFVESVVINGGDCKKTKEFLENYTGKSLTEKDSGIADAFNKGIQLSAGNYIMFLNSGDELLNDDYLRECKNKLDSDLTIGFIHSNILFVDSSGKELIIRPSLKNIGRGMPYLHPTMIVRKNVFDKIGLFNSQYKIAMDFDWIVRLRKAGISGYYINSGSAVKMDGSGKSVEQEFAALKECSRALINNKMLNFATASSFSTRLLLYSGRRFLGVLGLDKLLWELKKLKHNK